MMIRIVLLGSGNVARHLYTAFSFAENAQVIQCYNRKGALLHPEQQMSEITDQLHTIKDADIYILAINDDVIKNVSNDLPFQNKLVVHVSGSVPMGVLSDKNRRGVFYPLQTFSKEEKMDYSKIPFCLEATNDEDLLLLQTVASSISKRVYTLSSDQRGKMHIAAVFVNNFTNYLYTIGKEICDTNQIPFEILYPLIEQTSKKIEKASPEDIQTGPAIRGDVRTIKRHISSLENETHKEIYNLLTKAIQTYYGKKL